MGYYTKLLRKQRKHLNRLHARYRPREVGFDSLTREMERELNAVCDKFQDNLTVMHSSGPMGRLHRKRALAFAAKQRRRLRGNQWRTYDRMFVLDGIAWAKQMTAPDETYAFTA